MVKKVGEWFRERKKFLEHYCTGDLLRVCVFDWY